VNAAKKLRNARRRMAADPAGAPAVRRSLKATLAHLAAHSPDGHERQAATQALVDLAQEGRRA
jgi:hypothetical protein